MVHIIQNCPLTDRRIVTMFEDRKRLFVDVMKWEVPVIAGHYEIDAFDGTSSTYLICGDDDGAHAGSLRLLSTLSPHILGDLFAFLCEGEVPRGRTIFEITRLCLPCRLGAERRRAVRDKLISAMVDHALETGITAFTGVVTWRFIEQVLAMGWKAHPLDRPGAVDGVQLGAFHIDIDDSTPERLRATGIYQPNSITGLPARQAA